MRSLSAQSLLHSPPSLLFPLCRCSSSSSSSKRYLMRQKSDPFSKSRSQFVSRAAHKLLELHSLSQNRLLKPGMTIVDLGAAPGGWVQAAHSEVFKSGSGKGKRKEGVIVAVDLLGLDQSVKELEGVYPIQGDFLDPIVQAKVVEILRRRHGGSAGSSAGRAHEAAGVDLVLSDMLANVSGNHTRDEQLSLDLCAAVVAFAVRHLSIPSAASTSDSSSQLATTTTSTSSSASSPSSAIPSSSTKSSLSPPSKSSPASAPTSKAAKPPKPPGPVLIIKYLQSQASTNFQHSVLKKHFKVVRSEKPTSSRPESRECYWVCEGFLGRSEPVDGEEDSSSRSSRKVKEEEEGGIFF